MLGVIIQKGRTGIVLPKALRTGNTDSDPFWLLEPGAGILSLEVDSVGAPAGVITEIHIDIRIGSGFKAIYSITGLAINAAGRHAWLITNGSPQANSWNGVIQGLLPERGRIRVVHSNQNDQITYGVKLTSIGA